MRLDVVAVELDGAADDGPVLFANLAAFELAAQEMMDLVVLGDDDHAGRVAVESMDDSGPQLSGDVAELVEVKLQRAASVPR